MVQATKTTIELKAIPARILLLGLLAVSAGLPPRAQAADELQQVLLQLRKGPNGFALPTLLLLGDQPETTVAAGDFNADGNTDLVLIDDYQGVRILPGNGAGGFGAALKPVASARQTDSALGDFNGDGVDDVAVADRYLPGLALQFGDRAGGFHPASGAAAVLVADFDGNGAADAAVVDGVTSEVLLLLHDGKGGLKSRIRLRVAAPPSAIVLGDFNGDGIADMAVASRDASSVYVLLGDGRGAFKALAPLMVERWPTSMAVGDFNRDGVTDMAVAHAHGVSVLLGSGQGELRLSDPHSQ